MVIENKSTTLRLSQLRYITAIIFFPLIIVLIATDLIETKFMGLTKYHWALIAAVVYILQNAYEHLKDLNYIYFSDEKEGKLLLRYASLRPFSGKKFSIEMNEEDLHSYKILRHTLKKELQLYVRTPQGVAKYPPISISALNEDEFNQMKKILNDTLERNKQSRY